MEIRTTNVYEKNYNIEPGIKIVINRWWTRSWKTYNILHLFLVWLISWLIDNSWKVFDSWVLHIVRKHSTTLRWSVLRDFEELIYKYELWSYIKINKTEKTYKFWNRTIEFIWADDQQKLRWMKRDILYCNEANELNYDKEFFQLLIRTKYRVFIDFNPDDEDIWINQELELKRQYVDKDVKVIVSTYKDNPFLEEWEIKEIERLETLDPMLRKIYWKWEYWKIQWVIFENWEIIEKVPENANFIAYWQDFWYTNDPTSLEALYKFNWWIVIDELIYETRMTNQDIIERYKNLWVNPTDKIWADSSEPKSIEEIYRGWFNIDWVTKWPDSIVYWISLMKQYKIYITARSINTIKEFKKYKWAVDREWKSLNKPVDKFNHWIDWIRYCVMMELWNKKPDLDIFIW